MSFGPLIYLHAYLHSREIYILDTVLRPCAQRCPEELITSAKITDNVVINNRETHGDLARSPLHESALQGTDCIFCLIKNILSASCDVLKADTV